MSSYPLSLPTTKPLITLTNPKDGIWVIELHNGEDSRLTQELVDGGLKPALDTVERHWRETWRAAQKAQDKNGGTGALIIVGKRDQNKFFSNGLDFASVLKNPQFFPMTFNPLLTRLLTFPMPVIAAINGHCFAGGFMLSLACDYRVMTDGKKRNAWLCMNEIHFGAALPLSFAAIIRAKVGQAQLHRKIALQGHRFTPQEALTVGLLDEVVEGEASAVLESAMKIAETACKNAQSGVYGLIKTNIYHDTLEIIARDPRITNAQLDDIASRARL